MLLTSLCIGGCERKESTPARPTVDKFECVRCHTIEDVPPAKTPLDCTQCHRAVFTDAYAGVDAGELQRWRSRIRHFRLTPSLRAVDRFERGWFEEFVQRPHSVRPGLSEEMPRLPISPADAKRLADELGVPLPSQESAQSTPAGDATRGAERYVALGCPACHTFTGAAAPPGPDLSKPVLPMFRAAPDLRFTRDRLSRSTANAWLADPQSIKSDSLMTLVIGDAKDRADLVAFLFDAPLKPAERTAVPALPEPLSREVRWDEINDALFHATCRHCHTNPGPVMVGEGGAGNTGGFGYPGAGLVLSTYEGTIAGSKRKDGSTRDVLKRDAEGVAPIVRHLMARHREVAGDSDSTLGMPLALPPVEIETIAMLRAWIAQGALR